MTKERGGRKQQKKVKQGIKVIKEKRRNREQKQKEDPLSHLSCGPSGATLTPGCMATLSSWARATGARVDVAAELPSFSLSKHIASER